MATPGQAKKGSNSKLRGQMPGMTPAMAKTMKKKGMKRKGMKGY